MSQETLFTEITHEHCPYCGAPINLIIDPSDDEDEYVEDCEVCCQPMVVVTQGDYIVELRREND